MSFERNPYQLRRDFDGRYTYQYDVGIESTNQLMRFQAERQLEENMRQKMLDESVAKKEPLLTEEQRKQQEREQLESKQREEAERYRLFQKQTPEERKYMPKQSKEELQRSVERAKKEHAIWKKAHPVKNVAIQIEDKVATGLRKLIWG